MKIPSGLKDPFISEWVRFNSQEMLLGMFIKPILFCAACFFLVACTPIDNISTMTPAPTVTVRATSLPATTKSPNATITPLTLHLFPTRTPLPTRIVEHPTLIPISKGAEECYPSLVVADYPGYGEGFPTPQPILQAFPPGWNKVSTLPEEFQGKYDTRLILTRPQKGYDEFWISVSSNPDNTENSNYFIYRTDTKEWARVPQLPNTISAFFFVDAENAVWTTIFTKDKDIPILYQLDEKNNSFVAVWDKERFLKNVVITSNIKVDGSGRFWFILSNLRGEHSSLYSFDPVTLELKSHVSGDFAPYIEIDENNRVYILHSYDALLERGWRLIQYDLATGLTASRDIPHTDDTYGDMTSMYLDHENRLWISDFVWYGIYPSGPGGVPTGLGGVPHIVIRSPIFIDYLDYLGYYRWLRPKIMLQSIDGRLWYQSSRGDAWFDHKTGEWCLFTPHKSNIVEDSWHNLWMLIGNDLYVLPLSP